MRLISGDHHFCFWEDDGDDTNENNSKGGDNNIK
jgi:hypothetical protein